MPRSDKKQNKSQRQNKNQKKEKKTVENVNVFIAVSQIISFRMLAKIVTGNGTNKMEVTLLKANDSFLSKKR